MSKSKLKLSPRPKPLPSSKAQSESAAVPEVVAVDVDSVRSAPTASSTLHFVASADAEDDVDSLSFPFRFGDGDPLRDDRGRDVLENEGADTLSVSVTIDGPNGSDSECSASGSASNGDRDSDSDSSSNRDGLRDSDRDLVHRIEDGAGSPRSNLVHFHWSTGWGTDCDVRFDRVSGPWSAPCCWPIMTSPHCHCRKWSDLQLFRLSQIEAATVRIHSKPQCRPFSGNIPF